MSMLIALYMGCYLDCNVRLLDSIIKPENFTPSTTERCITMCSAKGYKFAYTEAYIWCHCGNEVLHFTRVDDAECNTPCDGNGNQMCGGNWRASLYDLTVQTGAYGIIHNVRQCNMNGTIYTSLPGTSP